MPTPAAHLVYGLLWISFGIAHSAFAHDRVKTVLKPLAGRWYRLAYNLLAVLQVAVILWAERALFVQAPRFDWPPAMRLALAAVLVLGAALLIAGLAQYDLRRMAGLRQLRHDGEAPGDEEDLHLGGLHRHVRHPLYGGGILLLWGRVTGEAELATAVWGTAYILIGTWLEERRLLRLFGARYAAYRRQVPAYFPWPGRRFQGFS